MEANTTVVETNLDYLAICLHLQMLLKRPETGNVRNLIVLGS